MKEPRLRPCAPGDRAGCLGIFDSNVPEFFAPHERADFETDLEETAEYFVIEEGGQIVACGGLWLDGHGVGGFGVGGFVWGMVRRGLQGQGYGSLMVSSRLERLRELGAHEVQLDTSPRTAPFYVRFGFQEVRRTVNGYGPGLDRVDMVLKLERGAGHAYRARGIGATAETTSGGWTSSSPH